MKPVETRVVTLCFEEEIGVLCETLEVELLRRDLYRLLATPVLSEAAQYGDVVAATPGNDDILQFRRVVEPSGVKTWRWILTREVVESRELASLCAAVCDQGGYWDRALGGVVSLALPPDSRLDVDAAVRAMYEAARAGTLHRQQDAEGGMKYEALLRLHPPASQGKGPHQDRIPGEVHAEGVPVDETGDRFGFRMERR